MMCLKKGKYEWNERLYDASGKITDPPQSTFTHFAYYFWHIVCYKSLYIFAFGFVA